MDAQSLSTNLDTDSCVDSKSPNHKSVHNWDNYFICISLPYLGCLNSSDFARPNCFPLNIALNRYTICISVRTPHLTDTVYAYFFTIDNISCKYLLGWNMHWGLQQSMNLHRKSNMTRPAPVCVTGRPWCRGVAAPPPAPPPPRQWPLPRPRPPS